MIKSPDLQYLKHFFHYASRYKKTALIGLFMMPISVAANLLFPWLIIQVIDEHLTPGKYAGMMWTNPKKPDKMDAKGIETVRRDNCELVQIIV